MLDAFDLKQGKIFTAEEVSTALKFSSPIALFICHECQGELRFVNASSNRVAYFAHKSEAKVSAPCKFRITDTQNSSASVIFNKSFNERDLNGLVRAINKHALHYLFQYRHFFGAERNLYLKAKENSEVLTFDREDFWRSYLDAMFTLHRSSFSDSNRMVNDYFFKYLTQKAKIRPFTEKHIITEFHQVFHLAVSAAYSLVTAASKNRPKLMELKILAKTIKNFDFFSSAEQDLGHCTKIFATNIGQTEPKNYSDLASMLIAERFTTIVLDMDIRGFLMSPEDFIDENNSNGRILGFVYVLVAPKYAVIQSPFNFGSKDVIKVGETRRFPEKRAEELSTGFLFETWRVYDAQFTDSRLRLEEIVHSELAPYLIAKKEFFDYPPGKAMKLIRDRRYLAEKMGDPAGDKRNIIRKSS
ncbi:GIY-YIG nuclease family protein [Planktomarina temperata]|nr:GIY-YIG nuclease family protein [Planktomarina temperata]